MRMTRRTLIRSTAAVSFLAVFRANRPPAAPHGERVMRFGYMILYVPDVAAGLAFYEQAFGLAPRFVHESGSYAELETGTTALALASAQMAPPGSRMVRPDEPPTGVEIAFVTDDVAAAFARATGAGAATVSAPEAKPWGQIVAYVRDLNGFLVELCTPVGG
jgi:lactoylglutathione lyase